MFKRLEELKRLAWRRPLSSPEREEFNRLHAEYLKDLCTNKTPNQYRYEWKGEEISRR